MKTKFLTGIALLLAVVFSSCSDKDDYTINTADIITTVTTDNANANATSADVQGTVLDLSKCSSASYEVGVIWSTDSTKVESGTKTIGSLGENGAVTTHLTGLTTNVTYYYCTYVTLQSKVTRYGNKKSFITTDANIAAADAVLSANSAELSGTVKIATDASDEVVRGIIVSTSQNEIKTGRLYKVAVDSLNTFSVNISGLVPRQTYYYTAYESVNGKEYFGEVKSFTVADQEVEFVDLGLSVEWATVNIGASKPNEVGGLFGFADNTLVNISTNLKDYLANDYQGDDNDIATMCIDGAFVPSNEELQELVANTHQTSETVDGVPGVRFTADNGNSIFLPVTGIREGDAVSSEASLGAYWTGSTDDADNNYGVCLAFNANEEAKVSASSRYKGLAIRAVRMPNRPMNLDYLHQEWSIDLNELGKSAVFDGPLYYYGTADNWNSVTNGYKISGDSWNWCPIWSENTWICDAKDRGTMEFKADGTVVVKDLGNNANYTGTYTVDTEKHTITLSGAKILHLEGFDNIVSNWSTELPVLSLTEHGLQIGAVRDQNTTEGFCLLVHNYASSSLVGGNGSKIAFNNDNLIVGDIEGKGNVRLEIYNEYGAGTKEKPVVDQSTLSFNKNIAVTFKISGVSNNLKEGAVGQYDAVMSYADASWSPSYWGGTPKQDAIVTGDGEYTTWVKVEETAEGAAVWVIDIQGLASDIVDMSQVKAEIVDVTTDQNEDKLVKYVPVDSSKLLFNNKDGNGTDGRIEIYNEYGGTKSDPGVNQSDLYFQNKMTITFTIEGIDGNLVDGAAGDYKADISYADADWSPSYWGGGIGSAQVTKDGTYTVYANTGYGVCEGAVVWCIEIYGLWKDLVDPSKVKVSISEVATEAVKQ